MWGLCGCRHEAGVWIEPKTIKAKRADAAPGLALAIIDSFDVSHRTHQLNAPGGGYLPERRFRAILVFLDFRHIVYNTAWFG